MKSNIMITTIWNNILQKLEEHLSKATKTKGQNKHVTSWCKSGTRTRGPREPGTWDSGPPSKFKSRTRTRDLGNLGPGTQDSPPSLKVGPGTPLKFESGTPGPPSKFKSGTPGPPTKFKSGTFIIIFLHCSTYFVLDILFYIYMVIIFTNSRYSKLHSLFGTHSPFLRTF